MLMLLACMMIASTHIPASDRALLGLDDLRWNYRVILVYATDSDWESALASLERLDAEVEDRDIAWFVIDDETMQSNLDGKLEEGLRAQILGRYFTPEPAETTLLLVGKDGTLKSIASGLEFEAAFGLIDQMPMRIEEMRRKSEGLD